MTPPVTYSLTLEDVQAFRENVRPARRRALMRTPWLGLVLWGGALVFNAATLRLELRRHHPDLATVMPDTFLAGVSVTAIVVLLLSVYSRKRGLRRLDASLVSLGPIEIRADEEALEIRQRDIVVIRPWSVFSAATETPAHLFLWLEDQKAIVVPRRAVADTPIGTLLAGKIAAKAASR